MAEQKKKRAYAAQAYEFGANAPAAGAPGQTASFGMPPAPGIPQGPQDNLAGQFGQMNLGGAPAPQPGYPAPQTGYSQPGYQGPGIQQVTPQQPTVGAHLNQLIPSDLIQQVCGASKLLEDYMLTQCSPSMCWSWTSLPHPFSFLPMYAFPIHFVRSEIAEYFVPRHMSLFESYDHASRWLTGTLGLRYALTGRELPSQIYPLDPELRSTNQFYAEEIEAPFRTCHSTVFVVTGC
jgi:hypothetical protein